MIFIIGGLMMYKRENKKKVFVLGIDGMDPVITEQLIKEGKMPNFSYLKTTGSYSTLKTVVPTETVVVWSSFATGLNPGDHGIFDFIMRSPQDYLPYLSLNEVSTVMGKMKIKSRRKGKSFWSIFSKNNVPSYIYFCPNTFPPERVFGRMLSGMGVPDILGTMGKFTFYTTKPLSDEDKDTIGRVIHVEPNDNIIESKLYGPRVANGDLCTESSVPLKIFISPKKNSASFELQRSHFSLKEGGWSSWQKVSFKISPFKKVYGIARFYLKSVKPEFELYCSPINFDPQKPIFPISYPKSFSRQLAKKIGFYYTQGMPHDTWALTEDRLGEKAFLELTDEILRENENILNEELKRFKKGAFFFYFETLDMVQHMFWRYLDTKHVLYEKNSQYKDTIFKYYEKLDNILGNILKELDEDTILIVLSDHGFSNFRRSVHLNRWLLENGYLFFKEGAKESKEFFGEVDWSKTKAYALGFGGIYLNRIGREHYGIVSGDEAKSLKQAISTGLAKLKDTKTGEMVVKNVYTNEEIFQGSYIKDAPDLFVGFNKGFRASWQTALGGAPSVLIEDNRRKWSGDHLIDSSLVPGVIFINKKVELKEPSILDIVPTILDLFSIKKPKEMSGKILFKNE
jgi:predicted AlkP superfamily phosphohydrolase/phosphomutase